MLPLWESQYHLKKKLDFQFSLNKNKKKVKRAILHINTEIPDL